MLYISYFRLLSPFSEGKETLYLPDTTKLSTVGVSYLDL